MKEHSARSYKIYEADPDAVYEEEYTIDLSQLKPTVAFPHLPENTKTIDEITEDVKIDQAGHRLLHQRPHGGSADRGG